MRSEKSKMRESIGHCMEELYLENQNQIGNMDTKYTQKEGKLRWEESKKKENIRHCVEELCIDNQKLRPNEVKRTQRKRQRCKNRKK